VDRKRGEEMANVTIGHLLDHAREFERKLEAYYASIRDQSKDDGVRLLTYYLGRHRRHLDEALAGYPRADLDRLAAVRLKHDVDFDPEKGFTLMATPPTEVRGKELLEAAVGYDLQLVELYKRMLLQPLGEEAAAMVRGLIRVEEKDVVMLKKMIATNYF
jgi:rubrerythrin